MTMTHCKVYVERIGAAINIGQCSGGGGVLALAIVDVVEERAAAAKRERRPKMAGFHD
nr:hypothetical protein Itr_chr08CG20500 [Ipomoea trifida]